MLIWHGLRDALLMGWQILWALVFGFLLSAVVQGWVPLERVERALAGTGPCPVKRRGPDLPVAGKPPAGTPMRTTIKL